MKDKLWDVIDVVMYALQVALPLAILAYVWQHSSFSTMSAIALMFFCCYEVGQRRSLAPWLRAIHEAHEKNEGVVDALTASLDTMQAARVFLQKQQVPVDDDCFEILARLTVTAVQVETCLLEKLRVAQTAIRGTEE